MTPPGPRPPRPGRPWRRRRASARRRPATAGPGSTPLLALAQALARPCLAVLRCGLKLSHTIAIRRAAGRASAGTGRTPEPGPGIARLDVPEQLVLVQVIGCASEAAALCGVGEAVTRLLCSAMLSEHQVYWRVANRRSFRLVTAGADRKRCELPRQRSARCLSNLDNQAGNPFAWLRRHL
jgi:hypothetical protein